MSTPDTPPKQLLDRFGDQPELLDAAARARMTSAGWRLPDAAALKVAAQAAIWAAPLPVRHSFARRADGADRSPLMRLMSGGQGGEVALKLFLVSLLTSRHHEGQVPRYRAAALAEWFGLPDPEGNGARRVSHAVTKLHDHNLIGDVDRGRGKRARWTVRREDGSGAAHTPPFGDDGPVADEDRWLSVPAGVFNRGWLATLSGTALAVLLIVLSEAGGRPGERTSTEHKKFKAVTKYVPVPLPPAKREELYSCSDGFLRQGRRELEAHRLLRVTQRIPAGLVADAHPMNYHQLLAARFDQLPWTTPPRSMRIVSPAPPRRPH